MFNFLPIVFAVVLGFYCYNTEKHEKNKSGSAIIGVIGGFCLGGIASSLFSGDTQPLKAIGLIVGVFIVYLLFNRLTNR